MTRGVEYCNRFHQGWRALAFPAGFTFGTATSSYQVEGDRAGRGETIWDRFCAEPGRIADGTDGLRACEHVARYRDDVAMLRELGVTGYRFSISWPRVMPDGRGAVNAAGLDFYDRLVDELLAAGITPYPTLYHWDLPGALEDAGGWPARVVPESFADYAEVVVAQLGDRVTDWMTVNEPFVIASHGYLTGEHAPGRSDLRAALGASHHVMLAHGLAAERVRAAVPDARVGLVLNFTPAARVGDSPAAFDRFRIVDEWENQWYSEALAGNGYPSYAAERLGWDQSEVHDGDLALISAPIDALGVNFYSRKWVGALDGERGPGRPPETAMGWEIHAPSLGNLLRELHAKYRFPRYLVTENGCAMPDTNRADGRIADLDRMGYICDHLAEIHHAMQDGVPVEGYFVWSLMDNFEWAHGYRYRFGIVEVDFDTMRRTPKASAEWYSRLARSGILEVVGEESR